MELFAVHLGSFGNLSEGPCIPIVLHYFVCYIFFTFFGTIFLESAPWKHKHLSPGTTISRSSQLVEAGVTQSDWLLLYTNALLTHLYHMVSGSTLSGERNLIHVGVGLH